ncbi:MAG: hypothetical protein M3P06_23130 [Acidobacteriota bacterium]|nr:hypothetical protein [Acidobacteriota bacterium]
MLRVAAAALLFLQATTMCGNPARKELIARYATPFTVLSEPATATLDVARSKAKLASAAKSDQATVVLEIEGAAADHPPGFIVAVFVGEHRVGEVALYAVDQPQTFAFGVDDVVAMALRGGNSLEIRFLPESGLQGQPTRPEAPVRIAAVSLSIERQ